MKFEQPSYEASEVSRDVESEVGAEREREFKLDFYVTDHSADHADTGDPERLRELYADIKKDGVTSVRYDWHWRNVEPQRGEYSEDHLARYQAAKEIMAEVGLEPPTVILSNPPKWAVELYETDKEKFYEEYRKYAETVKDKLVAAGGDRVERVQILNELNNSVYTPVKTEDMPRLAEITREVFRDYNPEIKLMVTVLAANLPEMVKGVTFGKVSLGTPIEQYLPELKKVKDSIDVIAVDYYPGMWHLAPKDAKSYLPGDLYKAMVKNTELLKSAFEEIATWGKEYELGEIGQRTNMVGDGEKDQRYFYDAFFRAFKRLMVEMREKKLELPSRVGFYEAMDEPPRNVLGKVLRKITPFPEHDMGMRTGELGRKMILQGSPHASEEERAKQPSQLSRIILYLRSPMKSNQD